jgi:hypothetical protein
VKDRIDRENLRAAIGDDRIVSQMPFGHILAIPEYNEIALDVPTGYCMLPTAYPASARFAFTD